MRIALISDLHANEVALRAVLDDIDRTGVDQLVCLGDVATLGPRPREVLELLRRRGCPCILGNHEAFLLEPELIRTYTEAPVVVDAVDWSRRQLEQADLEFLRSFLPGLEIALEDGVTLRLFHGSPRSNMEDILSTTPADVVDEMLQGHTATVMAGGHTHIQMMRQHRGILLVNPGSVGLPFLEYASGQAPTLMAHAEYAVIEAVGGQVSVTLRRLPLERAALRAAAAATDNPLTPALLAQYA